MTALLAAWCHSIGQEDAPYVLAGAAETALRQALSSDHAQLIAALETFVDDGVAPFIIRRKLFRLGDLPPTPTDDIAPDQVGWRLPAAALFGLLQLSGHRPGSFLDE